MELVWISAILLVGMLFLLLGGGLWIGVSLIMIGVIGLQLFTGIPVGKVLGMLTWNTANSWQLACLPLFIFMGEVLYRTKVSEQLFAGLAPWIHRLPGKLLHINVLGCAMFAAISGSSVATVATMGKVTLPEFKKLNYNPTLSVGSLAGAGTLGFLIPPSIIMIIYGTLADASIGKLFIAGVLPGLMVAGLYMGYIGIRGLLDPGITPSGASEYKWKDRLRSIPQIAPVIFLMLLVLGAIYVGWATPTEAAAIGVAGAIIVAAISKSLSWRSLKESLMGATRTTCMIVLIVVGACFLATAMGYLGIPRAMAELVASWGLSRYVLLLALAILYIILGCFMDGGSIIVITLPITLPLVVNAGYDVIWFGIFCVVMAELCQITPPVGFNLFVIQQLTDYPIGYIVKAAFPFFMLLLFAVAITAFFPQIALWLPSMMIGK